MTARASLGFFLALLFALPLVAGAAGTSPEDVTASIAAQRNAQSLIDQQKQIANDPNASPEQKKGAQDMIKSLTDQLGQLTKGLMDADFQCIPVIPQCSCGMIPGKNGCVKGPNKFMCPCVQKAPTGAVTGKCVAAFNCKGESFSDQSGKTQSVGSMSGLGDILKSVGGLLQQMMQKGQQSPPPPPTTGTQGCTAYYQVSTPTTDPCAYYVSPTSSSLLNTNIDSSLGTGASDSLLEALGGGTSNVSDQLLNSIFPPPAPPQVPTTPTPTSTASASSTGILGSQMVNLQAGTRGNIELTPTGVTVVAGARDTSANTEVAGFYGSDTFGGEQPQGLAARLCQSRPWAGSIVTYVIPPSFFDSLCAWRGYSVGTSKPPPAPTPPTTFQQTSTKPTPPPPPPAVSTITPEIDIWAVPAKVPLGARTSVFWNTKGVDSCTVSSPDGSFEEHSLSGGAATVALSGPTTFTISCLTPDGKPVTDYVTVQLAI